MTHGQYRVDPAAQASEIDKSRNSLTKSDQGTFSSLPGQRAPLPLRDTKKQDGTDQGDPTTSGQLGSLIVSMGLRCPCPTPWSLRGIGGLASRSSFRPIKQYMQRRNGRGPHLEGRQAPQASSAFRTPTAGSLQSWDRRVRPRLV